MRQITKWFAFDGEEFETNVEREKYERAIWKAHPERVKRAYNALLELEKVCGDAGGCNTCPIRGLCDEIPSFPNWYSMLEATALKMVEEEEI